MLAVYDQLQNPLMRLQNAKDRARLKLLFPDITNRSDNHFLGLRRYVSHEPECFFNRSSYEFFLGWLKNRNAVDGDGLQDYLSTNRADINRSLQFLREINGEYWHDALPDALDEYALTLFVDTHIHPAYLRLVEAVLFPILKTAAHFSRLDRGKGVDGLNLWTIYQELSDGPFERVIRPYRHIVRNGIAHGGITYRQSEIRYCDKNGSEETLSVQDVVRLFDDLLDSCNGLAAALKVFLGSQRSAVYHLPQELLLEELQEETRCPWWSIEGCVQSEIGAQRQLLVYARPNSRDYTKIQMSVVQSGIMAEYFAPGFDRYFFSLRSPKALPGWAAFDGVKLREYREGGVDDITQYHGVVEDNLIFYMPKRRLPPIFSRMNTIISAIKIAWPHISEKYKQEIGIPTVRIRSVGVHRNQWGVVLSGDLVIDELDDHFGAAIIRRWRRYLVKQAIRTARRQIHWYAAERYLPLGYVRLKVFRTNYRRRRLSSFGLGADLVCTLQFQRMRQIQSPDIIGSTVETDGKWRLAWNGSWLNSFNEPA